MICEQITLTNFRNYRRMKLDLPPRVSLFYGENASGKSSLLEAVYFLATARSHRTRMDRELVNWEAEREEGVPAFARVVAQVQKEHHAVQIDITLLHEVDEIAGVASRKRIKINGVPRRAVDLVGQVNVVAFSPADMDLMVGAPALRRRYLDIMISQVDHRYIRSLQQYQRVLLQRNHLLRQVRERHRSPASEEVREEMAFWNQELSKTGSYIVARRYLAISLLGKLAQELYRQLSGTSHELRLDYVSSLPWEDRPVYSEHMDVDDVAGQLEGRFTRELEEIRPAEGRAGMTLIGPHRDDIEFRVDGVDMAAFGSRGQQRTITLALKLGEVGLMHRETGEMPILLLDDILSELDRPRRQYVMRAVLEQNQQVLITATDLSQFEQDFLSKIKLFCVEGGQVRGDGGQGSGIRDQGSAISSQESGHSDQASSVSNQQTGGMTSGRWTRWALGIARMREAWVAG